MNEFLSSTTTIMPEQVFVNSNLKRRAATKKINVAKRERNVMRTRALKTPSKRKSSVDEFMSFVFSSVTDPRFLVPFILAFSLLYAYKSSKDTSPIGVFIDNLKNNSNTAGVGSFLETNIKVLLGTIAFAPGLCVMPEAKRITMLVMVIAYVFMIPMKTYYMYTIEGVLFALYFKTSRASYKYFVIALAIGLYATQYLDFIPSADKKF